MPQISLGNTIISPLLSIILLESNLGFNPETGNTIAYIKLGIRETLSLSFCTHTFSVPSHLSQQINVKMSECIERKRQIYRSFWLCYIYVIETTEWQKCRK